MLGLWNSIVFSVNIYSGSYYFFPRRMQMARDILPRGKGGGGRYGVRGKWRRRFNGMMIPVLAYSGEFTLNIG